MTEITIPFWLNSKVLTTNDTVESWLQANHIRPRWVDEVIQMGEQPVTLADLPTEVPWLRSPMGPIAENSTFQAACREIAVGERHLILLVALPAIVLLASPGAVGMYNLFPQAYIDGLFCMKANVSTESDWALLETALLKKECKAGQISELLWLQEDGRRPIKAGTAFASATWVKPDPSRTMLASCHEVVQSLILKKQTNGLVVEIDVENILFATWIERV